MISPHADVLIRKLESLGRLSDEEKAVLKAAFQRVVDFGAHVDIVVEGAKPTHSNLLLEGWICRYGLVAGGKRQIYSLQFPGDIFDAHSFILQEMDHSVGTLTPCRIAMIPHATLRQITETYPRIARAIWRDTLVDAAIFRSWLLNVGRRSAYERIAHLMCESYFRLDAVGLAEDRQMDWPITQAEIADALALTAVHINRTLQQLRADGLIRLSGSRLTILDWPGLRQAAGFDPRYLHRGAHQQQSAQA